MKRIIGIILVAVMMTVALGGCKQEKDAPTTNKKTEVSETSGDQWPTEAVTIICPWAVGGLADQVNRAMSQYGKELLGQELLADNILGSGGAVALTEFLQEKPNSHKLIFGGEGSFAIAPLTADVQYKFEDFIPVINIYSSTFILSANPKTGITSFNDFEKRVKEAEVKIATNGSTSSEALQVAGLVTEMGGTFKIVSYDGANEALNAAVSGEVDFAVTHGSLAKEFVKSGDINPIVAFDSKKLVDEVYNLDCVEDYGYDTWMTNICAVFMRAGTDQAIVDKMESTLSTIMKDPAFLETASNIGLNINPMSSKEVEAYINGCMDKAEKYAGYLK